jgi:hypothetical protein
MDETNESVNFSRPFFAEVHRMDQANYLAPCWSVGGRAESFKKLYLSFKTVAYQCDYRGLKDFRVER